MPAFKHLFHHFFYSGARFRLAVTVTLFMVTVLLARFPAYNGDLPFYIAAACSTQGLSDSAALSASARAIRAELSPARAALHLQNLGAAPQDFLDFYRIKMGYTHLISLFHFFGVPYVTATIIPSLIAFVFLGCGVFSWGRKISASPWAFFLSLVLLCFAGGMQLGRMSTPDAPAQCLLFLALYRVYADRGANGTLGCLLLSLFFRPDNLPAVAGLLILMRFYTVRSLCGPSGRLSASSFLVWLVVAITCCGLINAWSEPRFWWFRPVPYPGVVNFPDAKPLLSLLQAMIRSPFPVLLTLATLVLASAAPGRKENADPLRSRSLTPRVKAVLLFTGLMFPVRYLLFPHYEDRFFVVFYLAGFLVLAGELAGPNGERG